MLAAALLVALALAADPAAPPAKPDAAPTKAAKKKGPRRPTLAPASLPTVEGSVLETDHRAHLLRLRTSAGESSLAFDRNTRVRAGDRAASVLDLTPGAMVRIGLDGERRAAWVEVLPSPSTPDAAP